MAGGPAKLAGGAVHLTAPPRRRTPGLGLGALAVLGADRLGRDLVLEGALLLPEARLPDELLAVEWSRFLCATTWKQAALPCAPMRHDHARKRCHRRYQRSPYALRTVVAVASASSGASAGW